MPSEHAESFERLYFQTVRRGAWTAAFASDSSVMLRYRPSEFASIAESSAAGGAISEPTAMEASDQVQHAVECILESRSSLDVIENIHPAYSSVSVDFNSNQIDPFQFIDILLSVVQSGTQKDRMVIGESKSGGRLVEIPTFYGAAEGPDLGDLAQSIGLTQSEVIRLHSSALYQVAFLGFSPGFPYLIGLPKKLRCRRRSEPRVRVPAGSVAIGGDQTGIYPSESPGGWNLIGRTNLSLFNPANDPPTLLRIGDRVRFVPQERDFHP